MRDPQGEVRFEGQSVIRTAVEPIAADHFLRTDVARELVTEGLLIGYTIDTDQRVISPRVSFVSHPCEWTDMQFTQAAALTLTVAERILPYGFELKDGSAWNIVFEHGVPKFCDHFSFQRIESKHWSAFAQFIQHFVLPLYLSRLRGLHASRAFKISRDALSPAEVRSLLGWRAMFSRCGILLMGVGATNGAKISTGASSKSTYHENLYRTCRWLLANFTAETGSRPNDGWINYTERRAHYADDSVELKRNVVRDWLLQVGAKRVLDLGANTGEFAQIAVDAGCSVIAVEQDHAALQKLQHRLAGHPVSPVLAKIDDISGGYGWAGAEHVGLFRRLQGSCDTLMMLAVIHHIAIAASIPYPRIVEWAHEVTNRYLIIELIESTDPQVELLAMQRGRKSNEFSMNEQFAALGTGFKLLERIQLTLGKRELLLMEKL